MTPHPARPKARSAGALLGVIILVASPAARTQQFENVVTFGDSLSDTGNTFTLLSSVADVAPVFTPGPESPPNYRGRFSNGPVWAEILARAVTGRGMDGLYEGIVIRRPPAKRLSSASGNVGAAVGGARADGDSGGGSLGFGLPQQISDFQAAGGTIGQRDLVTIWGGESDIAGDIGAGQDGARAAADAASAQAANVSRLTEDLGARTVLVPNMLPPPLGTAAFPLETFPTEQYNQALDAGLEAIARANPDVNIVRADITSMLRVMESDPQAFGFTVIDVPCAGGNFVTGVQGICARPEEHFLWQSVHPGAQGHRYIALFAELLLSTRENAVAVAPLPETSLYGRLDAARSAFERTLDAMAFPQHWRPGAFAEVFNSRIDGGGGNTPAYRHDRLGLRAGIAERVGGAIAGASIGYVQGDHDQDALSANARTLQGDIHVAARRASLFLSLDGGVSFTDFDNVRRDTGFGRLDPVPTSDILVTPLVADSPVVFADGDSAGWSYSAAVAAGAVADTGGGVRLVPSGRLGYVKTDIEGFREDAPILALDYAGREISSGFWSAALRAAATIGDQRYPLIATAEVGYEGLFATDTDPVTAGLVDNTALPVTVSVEDPRSRGGYLALGGGGYLDPDTMLSARFEFSLDENGIESHRGRIELRFLLGE